MSQTYELVVHSDEMCRSCLIQTTQLKTIFRCEIVDGEILPIPKIYTSVTDLPCPSEQDELPSNLCRKCEVSLIESYIFKEKCQKSYNLLRKILKLANNEQTNAEKQTPATQPNSNETKIDEQFVEMEDQMKIKASAEKNSKLKLISPTVEMAETEPIKRNASDMILSSNEEANEIIIGDPLISIVRNCTYCDETFDNYYDMQMHSSQHDKLLPHLLASVDFYRCSRCLFVFSNIDDLAEHSKSENCTESTEEIDRVEYLDDSDGNLPAIRLFSCSKNPHNNLYVCDVCQIEFAELIDFRNHFDVLHSNNADQNIGYLLIETPHFCGVCESRIPFGNLKSALHHVYFHQRDFKCPVDNCMIAFMRFMDLYSHTIDEHSLIRNYNCLHCSFSANSADELKVHNQRSCKARNFECNECGKMFLRKNTLALHLRSHNAKDRKYICNYCGKSFFQSIDLNNHVRIHTQERPYNCSVPGCPKRFKTISQRNGHVDTHNTENNYRCNVCLKSFKSERILHGHGRLHAEPQFACKICQKKFSRKYHLSLHTQRKHNGQQNETTE